MGWEEAFERRRRKEGLVCVLNTSNHVCPYSFNCLLSLYSNHVPPYSFNCLLSSLYPNRFSPYSSLFIQACFSLRLQLSFFKRVPSYSSPYAFNCLLSSFFSPVIQPRLSL